MQSILSLRSILPLLFCLFLFQACSEQNPHYQARSESLMDFKEQKTGFYLTPIEDTVVEELLYLDLEEMHKAHYHIIAYGWQNQKSLSLNDQAYITGIRSGGSRFADTNILPELYIDTKQNLPHRSPYRFSVDEADGLWSAKNARKRKYSGNRNEIRQLACYPVYLFNPHADSIMFTTQDNQVRMIQEAKDRRGRWKPIEYWEFSTCGNSYFPAILPPLDFALIKMPVYHGDFETEIRLKMEFKKQVIYSAPFKGSINESQFKIPESIWNPAIFIGGDRDDYVDRVFLSRN